MNNTIDGIISLAIRWLLFAAFITGIEFSAGFFSEGLSYANGLSLSTVGINYGNNLVVVLIAFALISLIGRVNIRKQSVLNEDTSLSIFSKALIVFLGLPIWSIIFSMVFVRLFEIFGFNISSIYTISFFGLCFWFYGVYKCKTVYFK